MKLSPTAVYTTIAPETVLEASRGDDPSVVMSEKKRWVTALRQFQIARRDGLAFPMLLSDARCCADLVYWAIVEDMKVTADGTRYTFSRLQGLRDCYTQDLVLVSEKRNISPAFIRPYALVQTPDFLVAASMDATERGDEQIDSHNNDSNVDWDQPELVHPLALEYAKDWLYELDDDGDVSRVPLPRLRGQVQQKVLSLAFQREPGFFYRLDTRDDPGVYRWPLFERGEAKRADVETPPAPKSRHLAPASVPGPRSSLALFSWGYAGWGSSVPQLLQATEAAERSRGFKAPVFVDVRFSRSVRAAGFRDRTFDSALPAGNYHWMKGLGNEGIASGGEMKIHKPEDAARLLDLAIAEREHSRRLIFFCSCESPEFCHRNAVRDLLLEEAKKRGLDLVVSEWPGGEPVNEPICALKVPPSLFSRILGGAPRIPIDEALALQVLAAHPWGGYIEISDGARTTIASVSPAKYSSGGWFVQPFVSPVDEGDQIVDLANAVRDGRAEEHYAIFT